MWTRRTTIGCWLKIKLIVACPRSKLLFGLTYHVVYVGVINLMNELIYEAEYIIV